MDVVSTRTNASSPIDEPTNSITISAISYFTITTDHFPWHTTTPDIIDSRRAALSDRLIFDILLTSGGVPNPDTLYPTDAEALRRLLDATASLTYDTLKKDCLMFFLLGGEACEEVGDSALVWDIGGGVLVVRCSFGVCSFRFVLFKSLMNERTDGE
jgi:hypothetical protein